MTHTDSKLHTGSQNEGHYFLVITDNIVQQQNVNEKRDSVSLPFGSDDRVE